jgi:hypothetical protein
MDSRHRFALALLLLVQGLFFLSCGPPGPLALTLLSANVGNAFLDCQDGYLFKLCEIEVEDALIANIAAHDPDVVIFQEILPPGSCDAFDETNAERICHPDHEAEKVPQARRLVGEGYTVACDANNHYECIALRTGMGTIEGCESGAFCLSGADTPPNPEGCDAGFSVSAVKVELEDGRAFTLVNGHPQSGFEYDCRAQELELIFGQGDDPGLVGEGPALVAGDFNLDPYEHDDVSIDVWEQHVGEGKRFRYHSGPAEREPPYHTVDEVLFHLTLDHVASDFAVGSCKTLGMAEGTERLDGGGGTDHRALLCALSLFDEQDPQ